MIRLLASTLGWMLLATAAAAGNPPAREPPPDRLPLQILDQDHHFGVHDQRDRPLVVIGRVDGIEDADLIDWYADDASRPAMPAAGGRTVLFLCGPVLSSGEHFEPVALERSGETFTITVQSWRDGYPRFKNIPTRQCYAIDLGRLGGDAYELIVEWHDLFLEPDNAHRLYTPVERRVGRLRFEVLTDAVDEPSPARLDAALVVADDAGLATATRGGRARLHGVVRRSLAPGAPRPETLGLTAGTADAGAWDANDPKSMDELIELGPACAGEALIARIVSPERSSGWWIQLRKVVRDDRGVRLVVEAWADYGLRDFDAPAHDVIVAPIGAFDDGEHEIVVEWRLLIAPDLSKPYRRATPVERHAILAGAIEQSRVALTFGEE